MNHVLNMTIMACYVLVDGISFISLSKCKYSELLFKS